MIDPILGQVFDEMRNHPSRDVARADWVEANLPFHDDPAARARLRIEVARRAALALGKLQAIDEMTARDSSDGALEGNRS